jgi:hypothetical protein
VCLATLPSAKDFPGGEGAVSRAKTTLPIKPNSRQGKPLKSLLDGNPAISTQSQTIFYCINRGANFPREFSEKNEVSGSFCGVSAEFLQDHFWLSERSEEKN